MNPTPAMKAATHGQLNLALRATHDAIAWHHGLGNHNKVKKYQSHAARLKSELRKREESATTQSTTQPAMKDFLAHHDEFSAHPGEPERIDESGGDWHQHAAKVKSRAAFAADAAVKPAKPAAGFKPAKAKLPRVKGLGKVAGASDTAAKFAAKTPESHMDERLAATHDRVRKNIQSAKVGMSQHAPGTDIHAIHRDRLKFWEKRGRYWGMKPAEFSADGTDGEYPAKPGKDATSLQHVQHATKMMAIAKRNADPHAAYEAGRHYETAHAKGADPHYERESKRAFAYGNGLHSRMNAANHDAPIKDDFTKGQALRKMLKVSGDLP